MSLITDPPPSSSKSQSAQRFRESTYEELRTPGGTWRQEQQIEIMLDGPRQSGVDKETMSKVNQELINAYKQLSDLPPAITIFGSARPKPGSDEYELARRAGRDQNVGSRTLPPSIGSLAASRQAATLKK